MVHFRCKSCGEDHPAPVPFAEKLYFDAAVTLDFQLECPESGDRHSYNKTDLIWRVSDAHHAVGT